MKESGSELHIVRICCRTSNIVVFSSSCSKVVLNCQCCCWCQWKSRLMGMCQSFQALIKKLQICFPSNSNFIFLFEKQCFHLLAGKLIFVFFPNTDGVKIVVICCIISMQIIVICYPLQILKRVIFTHSVYTLQWQRSQYIVFLH